LSPQPIAADRAGGKEKAREQSAGLIVVMPDGLRRGGAVALGDEGRDLVNQAGRQASYGGSLRSFRRARTASISSGLAAPDFE